jgi:hypothetical protein
MEYRRNILVKEKAMEIEVLYIRECPGYSPTLDLIQQILAEDRIQANITSVEVTDPGTPGFHGSPTVRINGRDVENVAGIVSCGLACRTYAGSGPSSNLPSADLIRTAIRREQRFDTIPPATAPLSAITAALQSRESVTVVIKLAPEHKRTRFEPGQ